MSGMGKELGIEEIVELLRINRAEREEIEHDRMYLEDKLRDVKQRESDRMKSALRELSVVSDK